MVRILHHTPSGTHEVQRSIVNILTDENTRTSLWTLKQKKNLFEDIIGINSVCEGEAVKLAPHIYERGLINPNKRDSIYFIDKKNKSIYMVPNTMNLFYDKDKVWSDNKYIWDGTFEELLQEFEKAGYKLEEKSDISCFCR